MSYLETEGIRLTAGTYQVQLPVYRLLEKDHLRMRRSWNGIVIQSWGEHLREIKLGLP